ncbi:Trm112 family protein [Henriciella sp.]|uniref:Trm112 family protein n=1 Tax=Henriciella sp. TaxID=1968823 RepID=UPI002634B185|nr:Trm112 family protein [Henriciella sp.]
MTDIHDTPGEVRPKTDPRLLELLICPVTRTPLKYDRARQELVSQKARLAYPIRDGLPIMLESEARPIDGDSPE